MKSLPSIVYADEHLLVCDKPADLLTVPGRGPDKQDCLINRLLPHYPNARIVHRLDYATSGLILIPLSHQAQVHIGRQFERRTTTKRYIAQVEGLLAEDEGEVDLPLICDWPNRPRQKVCHEHGKPAQTRYQVLSRNLQNKTTRVALTPITGRSHQLRVHLMSLGHPILGDRFYAPPESLEKSARLQLHASQLSIDHPASGERVSFQSEPEF